MLCIAMANAFGTFLIIIGLGYGAVKIPMRLFRFSSLGKKQKFCEFMVGSYNDKMEEVYYGLELELKLFQKFGKDPDVLNKYSFEIDKIMKLFPQKLVEELDHARNDNFPQELLKDNLKQLSYKYLVNKHLSIKSMVNDIYFYKYSIVELSKEALKINLVTKSQITSGEDNFGVSLTKSSLLDKIKYSRLRGFSFRMLGLITSILSFMIILGEVLIMTNYDLSFLRNWFENTSFFIF